MRKASEQGTENNPVKIYLTIIRNRNVPKHLQKTYETKTLEHPQDTCILVEVPTKNLRNLIDDSYVLGYEWSEELKALAN